MNKNQQTCETCYRIACRKCDWVANAEDVIQIQKQILTACPQCGWKPGDLPTPA